MQRYIYIYLPLTHIHTQRESTGLVDVLEMTQNNKIQGSMLVCGLIGLQSYLANQIWYVVTKQKTNTIISY